MGTADYYYDLIKKGGGNSTSLLVNFYKSLFELDSVNSDFYSRIGRLVKIYGEDLIFFAILDCSEISNVNHESPFGLIIYFAKNRLAEKYNFTLSENLSKLAQKNIKEMEKKKRLRLDNENYVNPGGHNE